jgi:LysM repeat protein
MARYNGKHRRASSTSRAIARVAVAGAAIATPIAIAAPAADAAPNWDMLAQCESSGNWSINTGNGFSGGLQFTPSTWAAYGGTQYASSAYQATREQQISVAEKVLASQGANAWPGCTAKLNWTTGGTKVSSNTSTTPKKTETKVSTSKPAVQANGADYTVQLGDTLSKIGEQFGVNYQTIAERNANIIKDPNLIYPGQQLDIK